jgi:uncharacterized surface protein with fasciclin (FAS1) repeats
VTACFYHYETSIAAIFKFRRQATLEGRGPFTVFPKTDIRASNGVIHVIDTVILPKGI